MDVESVVCHKLSSKALICTRSLVEKNEFSFMGAKIRSIRFWFNSDKFSDFQVYQSSINFNGLKINELIYSIKI